MAFFDFRVIHRYSGLLDAAWPKRAWISAIHAVALVHIYDTEYTGFRITLALLAWGFLNYFWLIVFRRPAMAAALSLIMIEALIVLSRFKFDILEMNASFFDFLVIDADTVSFLLRAFPDLRMPAIVAILLMPLVLILIWRLDPFRVRRRVSAAGGLVCLVAIVGLAGTGPEQPWEAFQGVNHISYFARSGVASVSELMTQGFLDSDPVATDRLKLVPGETCQPAGKPFIDLSEMGATDDLQPDRFFYDHALNLIRRELGATPLFMFAYVTVNHFPWDWVFRPDLTPDWQSPGNDPSIDEYIRRQTMSAHDYADFLKRLALEFPQESFLVVRFGDHQPALSAKILDPSLDDAAVARRFAQYDPQFFKTYYAIDTINFKPVDLSSALDVLDAPYLPLVIQEAAGLKLDPSFAEQKRILNRCGGLFYGCAGGAEARRFNRMLIDAGLIKGL